MKKLIHPVTLGRLAVCFAVACLGSCERNVDSAAWELEEERVRLSQRLTLLHYRLERLGPAVDSDTLQVAMSKAAQARQQVELLNAQKLHLQQQVARLEVETANVKELDLRQRRNRASGTSMAEFRAGDGRTYHDATIVSIDDAGVSLRHRDGSSRLGFSDLTPEQRDQYGIDAAAALAALEVEREQLLAYELWVEETMAALQAKARAAAAANAEKSLGSSATLRAASMASPMPVPAASHSRLQAPTKTSGRTRQYVRQPRQRSGFYTYVYTRPTYYICPPVPAMTHSRTPGFNRIQVPVPVPAPCPVR